MCTADMIELPPCRATAQEAAEDRSEEEVGVGAAAVR